MDEMIKKVLNEFAKKRKDFTKEVRSKHLELFRHIAKITLYAKYDKQNFNH